MLIETINPTTGMLIHQYEIMKNEELIKIIKTAHAAFLSWQQTDLSIRCDIFKKTAKLLRERKTDYAILMATEMGKPIKQGEAEIEKCAWVSEFYAEKAHSFLKSTSIKTEFSESYVSYEPLGIIFAIMPWNFPFWQVFRFLAPNLIAGNAALLSHAPISTGSALAIEALMNDSGLPKGLFRSLIIDHNQAADVIKNPLVAGVSLTGSERAGRAVASEAGLALKKVVLELGGNDAYLILDDADIREAVNACISSRLNNCGQVCIAAKRLLIDNKIADLFENELLNAMQVYQPEDPLNRNTLLGPMARKDLRETLHQQVRDSIEAGANLVSGGILPLGAGYFYPPTLLTGVKPGMPAFDEELFGPVISCTRFNSIKEGIKLANQSRFGLGAAVFSSNLDIAKEVAQELQAGSVAINTFVSSDPRLPFGGIKQSGYGRELSQEGMLSFLNIKTVTLKSSLKKN